MNHSEGNYLEQLPNDVWLRIIEYVSYTDLLQLRLVSKRWRDVVNRRIFRSRTKIIINARNLWEVNQHVQSGESSLRFECLELRNLQHSPELEQLLQLVGAEVLCLQVRHAPVFRSMDGNMPNLKMLAITTTSFVDDCEMCSLEGINLKQFVHLHSFECDGVSLDSASKLRMLQQLRKVESKVRLKHLQFEYRNSNETALLEVMDDHAVSLEHLDIFFSCSPDIGTARWRLIFEQMSKLRTLKLSGNCHHNLLQTIMEALPAAAPLQELDLTGMLSLTNEIFLSIALKWQHSLRMLYLMFCVQLDERCFKALQHLNAGLRGLTVAYCRELTGRGLLEGLALRPNYALQELYLEEVCSIDEHSVCRLLEHLPNLRKLSMDSCRNAVTDRTLGAIFQHQTLLQELNIDYCSDITDAALLGRRSGISRLRGLRTLNMRGCRNLGDRVLARALHLPELRSLSVGYCHRFTSEGIERFTRHCPAVEKLCLASCILIDDEAVTFIMQNLKRLRSLNVSNCLRISTQSIHTISELGENLVELTACGIDQIDSKAAKIILQNERPQLKQVYI